MSIRRVGGMSSPMGSVGWLILALPLPLSYPALQGCLCAVVGLIVCSIRGGSATANMDERKVEGRSLDSLRKGNRDVKNALCSLGTTILIGWSFYRARKYVERFRGSDAKCRAFSEPRTKLS